METVVVVFIVGAALVWAGREGWRAVRPRRQKAGGCPSASRCAMSSGCGCATGAARKVRQESHPN